ncbi:MAG: hypothetical protein ABSD38_06095 [Syntrophorhabdales bacterium]
MEGWKDGRMGGGAEPDGKASGSECERGGSGGFAAGGGAEPH